MARHQAVRQASLGDDQELSAAVAAIERLDVRACRVPTVAPQSDGTAEWSSTTIVLATARAAGVSGLGYSYVTAAAAKVIEDVLAPAIVGVDAMSPALAMQRMLHAIRNHGRPGIAACAISAVDVALWDLKARLLDLPLARLLGALRAEVPVYASGGFTSKNLDELSAEVAGYRRAGHRRVKIKIGREPEQDVTRVRVAREAAGPDLELMVDANGAYTRKQALAMADAFAAHDVVYFEEPVSSDDLEGLAMLRDRAPMAIAAGEYGYDAFYFRRMLDSVDILQADATRCLGITGFLQADAQCDAAGVPLSSHCAPALHASVAAAARRLVHVEAFADHVRLEQMLFDGAREMRDGMLAWNASAPGLGLTVREPEARRHAL